VADMRLDKILEKKGVSKRQFSKMLEEDESNVYRYFRDGYDPKLSTLKKWASKLKMKVHDLVKELLDD
jgi:ribosome-binding protein aMBF1 (putative translation factor)